MAQYEYVSPGRVRDPKTGKVINRPASTSSSRPATRPASNPNTRPMPPRIGNINDVNSGIKADAQTEQYRTQQEQSINNPNQFNPFGSQTVTYDEFGRPTVTQTESAAQQGIRQGDEAISQMGRGFAQSNLQGSQLGQAFNPNLTARTGTGDLLADRARIEDTVYQNLTRGLDNEEKKRREEMDQTLAARGIPLNPNDPTYKNFAEDFNKQYADRRAQARGQAVQMGGEEYQRSFGIGETARANDFTLQSGARSQQLGEAQQLSGMGPGYRDPNYQGFQGSQFNLTSPTALDAAMKQLANQRLAAGGGGRSGGGGSSSSTTQSAFVG